LSGFDLKRSKVNVTAKPKRHFGILKVMDLKVRVTDNIFSEAILVDGLP